MFFQSGPIQVFQVPGFGQGRKIPGALGPTGGSGLGGGPLQFSGGPGGAETPRGQGWDLASLAKPWDLENLNWATLKKHGLAYFQNILKIG